MARVYAHFRASIGNRTPRRGKLFGPAQRESKGTADFRRPGPRHPLPLNHLPGENRGTAGRIGEVGLSLVRNMKSRETERVEVVVAQGLLDRRVS